MSTRSIIAIKYRDIFKTVYCHFDGYPEKPGVGWMLKKYYTSRDKVLKLIDLGDISSLKKNIGSKHDFNNPPEAEVNVYHRDRGEPWDDVKPGRFKTFSEVLTFAIESWADYLYVFDNGEWMYMKTNDAGGLKKL